MEPVAQVAAQQDMLLLVETDQEEDQHPQAAQVELAEQVEQVEQAEQVALH